MARPKDENGKALPQAWRRLPEARALEFAGVTALAADGRLAHLDLKRKLVIARKAIDHVVDGDLPPPALFKADKASPANCALAEGWAACVQAVIEARGG
jgi:hypothetical protein